jgi:hypothetical protein
MAMPTMTSEDWRSTIDMVCFTVFIVTLLVTTGSTIVWCAWLYHLAEMERIMAEREHTRLEAGINGKEEFDED